MVMCTLLVHFWPLGDQVEEREREKKEKHQSCIQKCVVSGFEVNKPYLHYILSIGIGLKQTCNGGSCGGRS